MKMFRYSIKLSEGQKTNKQRLLSTIHTPVPLYRDKHPFTVSRVFLQKCSHKHTLTHILVDTNELYIIHTLLHAAFF